MPLCRHAVSCSTRSWNLTVGSLNKDVFVPRRATFCKRQLDGPALPLQSQIKMGALLRCCRRSQDHHSMAPTLVARAACVIASSSGDGRSMSLQSV